VQPDLETIPSLYYKNDILSLAHITSQTVKQISQSLNQCNIPSPTIPLTPY